MEILTICVIVLLMAITLIVAIIADRLMHIRDILKR